jgi:beta-galactosidase GanA
MKAFIFAAILSASYAGSAAQAQTQEHPIPSLVQKDGRFALLVDGAPYLILGAQANNSSDWPAMLPKVWPAMDTILAQAREHHKHLVLLWFGTWKNGSQHYMPEWMKLEPERYFHVTNKDGDAVDSPSPFATASLDADTRAFAEFMHHLKAADPDRTVLMVQVENETGTSGSLRDYSPAAQKLFAGPVPANVLRAMNKAPSSANWQDAFGPDADVCFHAWAVATYVNKVAAAGKAVYPLPLYVNAALRDPFKGAPGSYESGGPTDNVLSIWKVAAPAIDFLAPDIYLPDTASYLKVLELYHRPDNALFVPETTGSAKTARFFFSALGLQAINYSPLALITPACILRKPTKLPAQIAFCYRQRKIIAS